jgi:fumarate hydratase subunit alpha
MRILDAKTIIREVAVLCGRANYALPADVDSAMRKAAAKEVSLPAKDALMQCVENSMLAGKYMMPLCQDTGLAVFFVEFGTDLRVKGGIYRAIESGVRAGYKKNYLRASVVGDPLRRKNTGDNTPPVIHLKLVPGNKLKITFMPKGGGAENMSRLVMLAPYAGEEGVVKFVVDTVEQAGPNPCPPIIVGVGIGGTFDTVAILAKKALLRKIGSINKDPYYKGLEKKLLNAVNKLGIGAQGLGGRISALSVFIEHAPCHIASLPVAVNIQCHVARHESIVL